jgi:hypothetical protein
VRLLLLLLLLLLLQISTELPGAQIRALLADRTPLLDKNRLAGPKTLRLNPEGTKPSAVAAAAGFSLTPGERVQLLGNTLPLGTFPEALAAAAAVNSGCFSSSEEFNQAAAAILHQVLPHITNGNLQLLLRSGGSIFNAAAVAAAACAPRPNRAGGLAAWPSHGGLGLSQQNPSLPGGRVLGFASGGPAGCFSPELAHTLLSAVASLAAAGATAAAAGEAGGLTKAGSRRKGARSAAAAADDAAAAAAEGDDYKQQEEDPAAAAAAGGWGRHSAAAAAAADVSFAGHLQLGCYGDEQFDMPGWQDDDDPQQQQQQQQQESNDFADAAADYDEYEEDGDTAEGDSDEPFSGGAFGGSGPTFGSEAAAAAAAAAARDASAGFTNSTRKVRHDKNRDMLWVDACPLTVHWVMISSLALLFGGSNACSDTDLAEEAAAARDASARFTSSTRKVRKGCILHIMFILENCHGLAATCYSSSSQPWS